MKIAVVGLWHLGSVFSACLASLGNDVIGIDENPEVINSLMNGKAPLYEAGLDALIANSVDKGVLEFTTNLDLVDQCDVVWVTVDTPVNSDETADIEAVLRIIESILPKMTGDKLLIVSSQLPVGTMSRIKLSWKSRFKSSNIRFAVVPENLRLGNSIQSFKEQNPWIVGTDEDEVTLSQFCEILKISKEHILTMSPSSAEMTKHAINTFLALSVAYANEIGKVCLSQAATPSDVMRGVMSDPRIGYRAYLKPGKPIEGGTLLRDVKYLQNFLDEETSESVIASVMRSNAEHKIFIASQVISELDKIGGEKVGIAGVGYKKGSGTARRSFAIEIATILTKQGYEVLLQDDYVKNIQMPSDAKFNIVQNISQLIPFSDVLVWNRHDSIENYIASGLLGGIPVIDMNDLYILK